jgi:succinoglycan biosynthesis protein ExoW
MPEAERMSHKIAIVMPYFQRQRGILRDTVQFVLAQRDCPDFNLIIVDDGSPVPAEEELQDLNESQLAQVTLIRQPNQGVAGACNTGLAAVPPTADWIARLDSDDHWQPYHLCEAIKALDAGFDFFFANEKGAEPIPRLQFVEFWPSEHIRRAEGTENYEMRPGAFLEMMAKHAQVCTSTIVMRRSKFSSLRYRKMYAMCEDMHFFLDIALQSPKVAFSPVVHVTHGPGLHVNQVADWKSNQALRTACDFMEYYERILREVTLTAEQFSMIRQRYTRSRSDVATVTLGMLKSGRIPDAKFVSAFVRYHPSIVKDIIQVVLRWIARLRI